MESYTFHNVRISLKAKNGVAAYSALCNALAVLSDSDWETHTFTVGEKGKHKATNSLWGGKR